MTVELWIGQEFETPHEREDFQRFVRDMEESFGQSDQLYLLLANYFVDGRQVDLTVLKNDAIVVIELKRCAAPFWATENGPWRTRLGEGTIIGTGDQNPFEQACDYRFRWVKLLETHPEIFPPGKAESMNLYHVSAFVAISPALHPQTENHLSASPWFRLLGLDELSVAVQAQTSPRLNFSDDELRNLAAKILNLARQEPDPAPAVSPEQTASLPVESGLLAANLPQQIGRYQPRTLVGQGGMGIVYQAYDPHLNREVVLKLIKLPDPAKGQEFQERFRREVQAAGQLNHPHIVTIYDVNLEHKPPFVVMELLTGGTLQDRLRSGPLAWQAALSLLRPLVEALAYAHRVGVVHRDVKPANVLFGGEANLLKLVDFGLARWQSSEQITHSGIVVGTPAYMSPEQARGEMIDARTDIFALGIILYEALLGYNPLLKESLTPTLLEAISDQEIDLASLADRAPQPVIRLIGRAVARDRNARYPNSEALLAELDRCLPDLSTLAMLSPLASSIRSGAGEGPDIRQAADINLSAEVISVLRTMFDNYSRVAVEAEFDRGFSGSHVFQIRLVEAGDRSQLPAVVKIAPINLIHQEVQAYKTWVENRLPNIAQLDLDHTFLADSPWGGLRYALVGGGTFEVKSLFDFCQAADIDDVCWVLESRLFEIMGQNWWLDNRIDRTFQMQADYDTLLPFNLLLKGMDTAGVDTHHLIGPDSDPARMFIQAGHQVQLREFVISKVDPEHKHVTLNLSPGTGEGPRRSYQVRLIEVPDTSIYQVRNVVDLIHAEVAATRHDLLTRRVRQVLGENIDLSAEQLSLSAEATILPALSVPNPLQTYHSLLHDFLTVKISTIHGDLNMENILVDPATGEVSLIDFATVRQGHVLHDLLRLETEVIIKLIPPALNRAALPPQTICPFYELLHQLILQPGQPVPSDLPWPTLRKAFKLLHVIRLMARKCLFNLDDWREYYRGLTLYLLGVLKFDTLDKLPTAPLPAQTAFWGAAAAQDLFEETAPQKKKRRSKPVPVVPTPKPVYEIESPYGTIHPRSQFYIERAADEQCRERISRVQPVTVFIQAPRQMGKSSLMRRVLEQAKATRDKPHIFIDFQRFPEQYFDDEESFLIEFCSMIGDSLGLPEAIDRYWQGRRTNIMKCSRYLSDYVIPQVNIPFVLAMDEVERMLTSPFRSNFFGMLRTWHNDRVHDENLAKLTLFLSSSTEPYLFIDNPSQSPFNVAELFTLHDFTQAEVEELNQRHRSPLTREQVGELMELVNGHPFLSRLSLYLLATGKVADFQGMMARATADNGPFGDHLNHYLLRVLQQPDLKEALARICRDHTYEENRLYYRLKGAGLIKKEGKRVVFRNKLYDRYFKERLND